MIIFRLQEMEYIFGRQNKRVAQFWYTVCHSEGSRRGSVNVNNVSEYGPTRSL